MPEQQLATFKKASRMKKLVMEIVPVCAAYSCSEIVHVPFLFVRITSGYQQFDVINMVLNSECTLPTSSMFWAVCSVA